MAKNNNKDYNAINWQDVVEYDEESPTFLRWRIDITTGKYKNVYLAKTGEIAGKIDNKGYVQLGYNKKSYLGHRIVWCLFNGELQNELFMDHLDGNRLNNRISNLKLVTRELNARNQKMFETNKSGNTGVFLTDHGCLSYIAFWNENKIRKTKSFSVNKYGLLPAMSLAISYRKDQINYLNKIGYNYTDRHGQLNKIAPNIFEHKGFLDA